MFSTLMGPDWSLLPPEMIELISQKITSMDQYVYFRAVCQPWRKACTPYPRHIMPPFPWLNLGLRKSENTPSNYTLRLYDFSKSKIHNIELSLAIPRLCDYSRGWIVLEKDKELSFVNPITRETKSGCFPSFAVSPTILGFARNEKNTNPWPSDGIDNSYISKIILTSTPSDKDCIAVAEFCCSEWELGFSRIGDACWTILKLREYGRGSRRILDFNCRNNLVYVINNKGCFTVYDLQDLSQKIIIDRFSSLLGCSFPRLVIGEGELDGVPLLVKHANSGFSRYEVYKFVGREWRSVRNIGNVVLLRCTKTCEFVSLENTRLNGWEANHICCFKDKDLFLAENDLHKGEIEMVSLENGSVKEVPTSLGLYSLQTAYLILGFARRV